jgi:hypothetical protein
MADVPFWLQGDQAQAAAPQSDQSLTTTDLIKALLGYGVRVAGPIAGSIVGGAAGTLAAPGPGTAAGMLLGGGTGGALSEALVEKYLEPKHEVNLGRVGVSGALGAIPGSWIVKSGKPLVSAGIGAGLGYAGVAGNKLAEGEGVEKSLNPMEWSGGELLSMPIGATVGGVASKIGHAAPAKVKEPAGFVSPVGKTDAGGTTWRVTPSKAIQLDKALTLNPEAATQVQQNAQTAASAPAKRIADRYAATAKGSLRTAAEDTRPSTTSSKAPFKPIENVVQGVEEGSRFSVPDPEEASIQDLVDSLTHTGTPEEASEATLRALEKPANKKMGSTQISQSRTAGKQAVKAEEAADLQNMKTALGGTSVSQVEQGAAKAQEQANKLKLGERAAAEVEAAKEGLVPGEPVVVDRVSAGEGPYKSSKVTRFAPPKPEGEGEVVAPPKPEKPVYTVDKVPASKDEAAKKLYTNIKLAKAHGKTLGADDILPVPGGYRLVFKDANLEAQGPKGTSFGTLDEEQEAESLAKLFKAMGWGKVPEDAPKWGKARANVEKVTQEFTPIEGETLAAFQKRSKLPFSKAQKILEDFKGQGPKATYLPQRSPVDVAAEQAQEAVRRASNDDFSLFKSATPEVAEQIRARVKASPAGTMNGLEHLPASIKGQKGEIDPALAAKILATGVGAAGGAVLNPDDRLKGALLGGAAGLGVAAGAPILLKGVDPTNLKALGRRVPDYYRGGLLSDPRSMFNNAVLGPMGSQLFGGLEQAVAHGIGEPTASPQGGEIVKDVLNVPKWLKGFLSKIPEAAKVTAENERAESGLRGNTPLDRAFRVPGVTMLAGDMNTRANLERLNIPEKLAREITLTNEPGERIPLPGNIVNWGKAKNVAGQRSITAQLMLPFKRTLANIAESGLERTPGVGELVNMMKDPSIKIPARMRFAQQSIGGGVLVTSYMAGASTPPEMAKDLKIHSAVSNFGGQYAALASLGFALGQAHRTGKQLSKAAIQDTISGLPLPTTEPLQDFLGPFLKIAFNEPITRKELLPKSVVPKVLTLIFGAIPQGESKPKTTSAPQLAGSPASTFELR